MQFVTKFSGALVYVA